MAEVPGAIQLFGAFIRRGVDARLGRTSSTRTAATTCTTRSTNGAIRGEPAASRTPQEIERAYLDQAMQIDAFLRSRRLETPGAS